jgi:NAD(P)-dependent dehydrogenase (short-subunit alcohol dehydrogenase family)
VIFGSGSKQGKAISAHRMRLACRQAAGLAEPIGPLVWEPSIAPGVAARGLPSPLADIHTRVAASFHQLGRLGDPSEVAEVVAFLRSVKSANQRAASSHRRRGSCRPH